MMNGGKDYFDSAHRRVVADFASPAPADMKEKIGFIRAAVPAAKRNDIVTVLQSHDYSVDEAIAALTKDGGRKELEQWTVQQGRKSKTRQGVGKQKKTASERQRTPETTGVAVEKEASPVGTQQESEAVPQRVEAEGKPVAIVNGYNQHEIEKRPHHEIEKRPHHARRDSVSSTGSSGSASTSVKEGGKKLLKDLTKSKTQLSRYQSLHDENCQVAEKRIKTTFARLQQCIADREQKLLEMLSLVRSQGSKLLASRHDNAEKLGLLAESMGSLSENAASDLRADIKHFLSERRIDEELAKMEWFSGSADGLEQEVGQLGKVPEIRHLYSEHKVPSNPSQRPEHPQGDSSHLSKQPIANGTVQTKGGRNSSSESSETQAIVKVSDDVNDLRLQAELHAKLKQAVDKQNPEISKQGFGVANGSMPYKTQSRPFQQFSRQSNRAQNKPTSAGHGGQVKQSAKKPQTTPSPVEEKPLEKKQSDMKRDISNPEPLPQRRRRQPRAGRQAKVDSAPVQGVSPHTEATRD